MKEKISQAVKPAITIAVIGAYLSCLMCMFFYEETMFRQFIPVWLLIIFAGLSFGLALTPEEKLNKWIKMAILASAVVIAAVLVCLI